MSEGCEGCDGRPRDGGGKQVVHWSKSNGFIERTIQSVQGLVRTLRSSLEAKCSANTDVACQDKFE